MRLSLESDLLLVELGPLERLFALHGTLRISLAQIERATTERPSGRWAELRLPGTYVPGLIKAGTYRWWGRKEFWYITRGKGFLVLHTKPTAAYTRVVLALDGNAEWAQRINAALEARRN